MPTPQLTKHQKIALLRNDVDGWNAYRQQLYAAHELDIDLTGANLTGVDLSKADLSNAYLDGATVTLGNVSRTISRV